MRGDFREAIKRIWHEIARNRRAAGAGAGCRQARNSDRVRGAGPYARRIRRRLHARAGHAHHCGSPSRKGIARRVQGPPPAGARQPRHAPPAETRVEAYRPERVICLGDSFDDCFAGERMAAADKDELSSLCASVDEWIWLGGNHDPETPAFCGGETRTEIEIGGAILRHEPAAARATPADCGPSPSEGQRAGRRLPLFRPLLLRFGGSAHHASLRRLCRRALMPLQSHPLAAQIGAQALHAPRREALARRLNWSAFRNPAVCNIIPETPEALSAMTATGWRSDQGL